MLFGKKKKTARRSNNNRIVLKHTFTQASDYESFDHLNLNMTDYPKSEENFDLFCRKDLTGKTITLRLVEDVFDRVEVYISNKIVGCIRRNEFTEKYYQAIRRGQVEAVGMDMYAWPILFIKIK